MNVTLYISRSGGKYQILPWQHAALLPAGNQDHAKKAYTHATAAALRMKESVMETVTTVQENAADILASAKDLNAQRAEEEAADASEPTEET